MSIAENVADITKRVDLSAQRSPRNPQEITLMAVAKTVSADRIREAYDAGIRVFGENRVQEFASKADALRNLAEAEWHLIGHLQSNKSAKATELFGHVDSLDSIRLAEKLNSAASQFGKQLSILIEINIGSEQAKSGVAPDSPELESLLGIAPELSSLEFRGLMTVPPYNEDPEQSRPYFRRMRALFEQIRSRNLQAIRMDVLSMGMSHDFEVAIEEGSTCVRIGTAIFGERVPQAG
ncbi:MAG: YggS family pyridoxal phosphate-dependent enzyme [Acidobacteria bacterium]|nr:MAG: YggS family pyridoxal phosphate-dependent enzyme [Acidobacteriota bacterium]